MKLKRIFKWGVVAMLLALFAWFQFAYWSSSNDCASLGATQASR